MILSYPNTKEIEDPKRYGGTFNIFLDNPASGSCIINFMLQVLQ